MGFLLVGAIVVVLVLVVRSLSRGPQIRYQRQAGLRATTLEAVRVRANQVESTATPMAPQVLADIIAERFPQEVAGLMEQAREARGDRDRDDLVYDFMNLVLPSLGYAEWMPRTYEGAYGRRRAFSAWRNSVGTPKALNGLAGILLLDVSQAQREHRRREAERDDEQARLKFEARNQQDRLARERADAEAAGAEEARRAEAAREWERADAHAKELLEREAPLVRRFIEVAGRKVRLLDEYGDENLGALDEETTRVLAKLKKKHPAIGGAVRLETALVGQLRDRFLREHDANPAADVGPVMELDGEGYEAQIMTWLRALGAEDVRGTPRTGDQGGDILFTYAARRVVVQCKRYKDKVSNKAVQEVHAAKSIYDCTDAWVVTTGTATPGARSAAQMTGVKLVEQVTTRADIQAALAGLRAPSNV